MDGDPPGLVSCPPAVLRAQADHARFCAQVVDDDAAAVRLRIFAAELEQRAAALEQPAA
jgi:hypothetical protein